MLLNKVHPIFSTNSCISGNFPAYGQWTSSCIRNKGVPQYSCLCIITPDCFACSTLPSDRMWQPVLMSKETYKDSIHSAGKNYGKASSDIQGCIQKFSDWVVTKSTTITTNTRWEATQRVMVAKLIRLSHKIAIQLHLVAESCTICSSRSRLPVRKLLVAHS
jgi:hypothetical protein